MLIRLQSLVSASCKSLDEPKVAGGCVGDTLFVAGFAGVGHLIPAIMARDNTKSHNYGKLGYTKAAFRVLQGLWDWLI